MAALPCMHHSTVVLRWLPPGAFKFVELLTPVPSGCLHTANSSPLPRFLSKPHSLASSPHQHQWTHVSGWGMQGCGTDHLCRSLSVLPATDWLLCSPLGPESPLLSQLISLLVRGLPVCGNFSSPSAPHQEHRSCPTSTFHFFLFSVLSYLVTWGSFLVRLGV